MVIENLKIGIEIFYRVTYLKQYRASLDPFKIVLKDVLFSFL